MKEGAIDRERAVVAYDQTPEVSEPGVGAFDDPSSAIAPQGSAILGCGPNAILLVRADQFDAALPQAFPQRIAVVGFVGDDSHRLLPRTARVMAPSYPDRRERRLREPDFRRGCRVKVVSQRKTAAVDHHHPLRPLAPLGFSDSAAPFFAGAKLPSRNDSLHFNCWRSFNSPRNARQIFNQTPRSSQSRSRRQHVEGWGNFSGKSCQRAPLRRIHRIPSSTRRFSIHGRPPWRCRGGLGSKGAIFFHCPSVSNGPHRAIGSPSALLALLISHFRKLNHHHFRGLSTVMQQLLVANADPAYGRLYLEKFFPLQFALPPCDYDLLGQYFDARMEQIAQDFSLFPDGKSRKSFEESLRPLWYSLLRQYLRNFRRMTLFFNAYRSALEPVAAEVNPFDMLVLQLVKLVSEEAYEFVYSNGPVFYEASWRMANWLERLSVDDSTERDMRNAQLKEFFDSQEPPTRRWIQQLFEEIFPTVRDFANVNRFRGRGADADLADRERRIYHPNFFPRYFIHQVPSSMYGLAEMGRLIEALNEARTSDECAALLNQTLSALRRNLLKRWDFLRTFANQADLLGDVQAEAIALGIAGASNLLNEDLLGEGEWGRARALFFVCLKRFSGTPKLQELIVMAIQESGSDAFAADVLRFSTTARNNNNIVTEWDGCNEESIRAAFGRRMRRKYHVHPDARFDFPRDTLPSFFIWVGLSEDDRAQEMAFLRTLFVGDPSAPGCFLDWVLPSDGIYQGDPLDAVGKLYPLDELRGIVERDLTTWSEAGRQAATRFLTMLQRRERG
jgi:hypothetical protein